VLSDLAHPEGDGPLAELAVVGNVIPLLADLERVRVRVLANLAGGGQRRVQFAALDTDALVAGALGGKFDNLG
jgi:hypothetical protein